MQLGTFEIAGDQHIGIVLQDKLIVNLDACQPGAGAQPGLPRRCPCRPTSVALIGQYEYGMKTRLYEIVNEIVAQEATDPATPRPGYIYDLSQVDTLAPLMPGKILNAAVNFYTHACEGCTPEQLAARTKERQTNRGVPYLFLKPTRGAIIGDGDEVIMPFGRDMSSGRSSSRSCSAAGQVRRGHGARPHLRLHDRHGYLRPRGPTARRLRPGSDWFVGKGHDTFAPQGPWIVPKEFFGDPMQKLHQQLVIDGEVMQEARAGDMIHSIPELIEYASSLITLFPGDMLKNGTSGGTGMGAALPRRAADPEPRREDGRRHRRHWLNDAARWWRGRRSLQGTGSLPATPQHLQEISATILVAPAV